MLTTGVLLLSQWLALTGGSTWLSWQLPHPCISNTARVKAARRKISSPAAAMGTGTGGIHTPEVQALNEHLPRVTHGLMLGTQTAWAALHRAVYASPFF